MKKILSLFGLIFAVGISSNQAFSQNRYENARVANYSVAKYNTRAYEHFSFWIDAAGKPLEISYSMKNRDKEMTFFYEGKTGDGRGFVLKAPNGATSSVYLVGNRLRVVNDKTKKAKIYKWEYEGPTDGIGTFCQACAETPKEAAGLLRQSYL